MSSFMKKRNLLLAFDAFGTLYKPNVPVPQAYGRAALRYGIRCAPHRSDDQLTAEDFEPVKKSFSSAFKNESARNPNYGKATGLGAEKWWANVIEKTFQPFLEQGQHVPQELIADLLLRYSTHRGYTLFPDVLPFFRMLKDSSTRQAKWKWEKTVVGIITNSDDRVPSVLDSFGLKVGPRRVGSSHQQRALADPDDDVSFVVLSYDVGFEKPDRRMFDAAMKMAQETVIAVSDDNDTSTQDFTRLYVGDSIGQDYIGAEEAGWNAVLVDRSERLAMGSEPSGGDPKMQGLYTETRQVDGVSKKVAMCNSLMALTGWLPNYQKT